MGEPPGAQDSVVLELRDPQGQPRFSLYRTDGGFRYTDASAGVGRVAAAPGGRLRMADATNGPLELWPLQGEGFEIRGRDGPVLRWTREGEHFRLGDGAGIPVARFRRYGEEAVGHDAGGLVVVRARQGGGRLVVSDRGGRTRALVLDQLGSLSLERAALAAFPGLGAPERALLLLALGESRLGVPN